MAAPLRFRTHSSRLAVARGRLATFGRSGVTRLLVAGSLATCAALAAPALAGAAIFLACGLMISAAFPLSRLDHEELDSGSTIELDDDGATITLSRTTLRYAWWQITGAFEMTDAFVLLLGEPRFHLIPRAAVGDEISQLTLRALLVRKLGSRARLG